MNISGRSLITFLKFEMEVLHARHLPQAELSSRHFTVSHSEVKEEQVLLTIVILKAILLRNTSAPVLGSGGMLFHGTVSERAFIPAEKSTGSARR